MTRRFVALAAFGSLVVLVASFGVAVLAAPPAAADWTDGPCPTTSSGVTVVVDFQRLSGGVAVRCALGSPSSGFDALARAGFTVESARRFPGFLCRIDGRPSPASDACIDASPFDASWSYWTADRGGVWTYSSIGGLERVPAPGSVEGWSFTDGSDLPPRIPPPARPAAPTTAPPATQPPDMGSGRAPRTSTPTTAAPTPSTPPATPGATGGGPAASTSQPGGSGEGSAPAGSPTTAVGAPGGDPSGADPGATSTTAPPPGSGTDGSTGSTGGSGGAASDSSGPGDGDDGVDVAAEVHLTSGTGTRSSGSPVGTLFGVVLVAVVGLGAGVTHRRRADGVAGG